MTLAQLIASLRIEPEVNYSVKQVAFKMDVSSGTIGYWCRCGVRIGSTRCPVILGHYYNGGHIVIPGKALIEFLTVRNPDI